MKVVSPKSLLPIAALSLIAVVGGTWSILGRIPVTVEGQGIIIFPSNILPLQLKNAGQISTLTIKPNDIFKKGQIIGSIDQTELNKQLQQQQTKLKELVGQNQASKTLQLKGIEQEKRTLSQPRQTTILRIQELQNLAPILKNKSQQSIQQQRQQIQSKIAGLQNLAPILKT